MGIFLGDNDVSAETFANHICYVADLVGVDHVGLGLDYKPPQKDAPNLWSVLRSWPDYWPAGQGYDTPKIKLFSPSDMAQVLCVLKLRG